MNNWKETTLGEICKIASGSTPSTKEDSFWDGNISWITPKDLSGFNSVFIERGERNITESGLKNSSAQLLPSNTVLFSSRAPIGYIAIAKGELTTNQGFKNIICDEKKTHFKFIYYWLKNRSDYIEKLSSGSTFSEASATLMKSLEINLPPIEEQKEIAVVLSSLDDKIELSRKQNETLEKIAQGIFKEWFMNFKIDGKKLKLKNGVPEGWRVGKLDDLCERLNSGGTPSTKNADYYNGNVSWFSTKELQDEFLFDSEKKITDDGLKNSSAKLFPAGSVLMAIYAAPTVGRLGILTQEATFNQAACGFIANEKIACGEFIYLFLFNSRDNFNNLSNGAAQQNLSVGLVRNHPIVIPRAEVMGKFKNIIQPQFKKILNNSTQIQTLSRLRDTLLPKLMSGEVKI